MSKVIIDRETQIIKLEDRWLNGVVDTEGVDVHVIVYRVEESLTTKFGAKAHIHKRGKGSLMVSHGAPKLESCCWAESIDAAVSAALIALEEKDCKI